MRILLLSFLCLAGCGAAAPTPAASPPAEPSVAQASAAPSAARPAVASEPWKTAWIDVFDGSVTAYEVKESPLEVRFFDRGPGQPGPGPGGIGGEAVLWPRTKASRRARLEQCTRVEGDTAKADEARLQCLWLDGNWTGDVTFLLREDRLTILIAAISPEGRKPLPTWTAERRKTTATKSP